MDPFLFLGLPWLSASPVAPYPNGFAPQDLDTECLAPVGPSLEGGCVGWQDMLMEGCKHRSPTHCLPYFKHSTCAVRRAWLVQYMQCEMNGALCATGHSVVLQAEGSGHVNNAQVRTRILELSWTLRCLWNKFAAVKASIRRRWVCTP